MEQTYTFRSSVPAGKLYEHISAQVKIYNETKIHNEYEDRLLLRITEQGFELGLKRSGHSDGYWYCAEVSQDSEGCLIRGEIVRLPIKRIDHKESATWKYLLEVGKMILFGWPIILFVFLWLGFSEIKCRIKGVPPLMTKEAKLMDFMMNHLHFSYSAEITEK